MQPFDFYLQLLEPSGTLRIGMMDLLLLRLSFTRLGGNICDDGTVAFWRRLSINAFRANLSDLLREGVVRGLRQGFGRSLRRGVDSFVCSQVRLKRHVFLDAYRPT